MPRVRGPDSLHEFLVNEADRLTCNPLSLMPVKCGFCGKMVKLKDVDGPLLEKLDTKKCGFGGEPIVYEIESTPRCSACRRSGRHITMWKQELTDGQIHRDREQEQRDEEKRWTKAGRRKKVSSELVGGHGHNTQGGVVGHQDGVVQIRAS
jgi:hypothetical protein